MSMVLNLTEMIRPESILDVGAGFGGAGFLIRQYFDLRPDRNTGFADWSIRIDGIEIFEKYLTPVHAYIYNEIFIGNTLDILREKNMYYDMILALDVIEHMRKDEGYEFIDLCRGRSDFTVISTPYLYHPQEENFFNSHERHLSGWTVSDFINHGFGHAWRNGNSIVAIGTEKKLGITIDNSCDDDAPSPRERGLIKELVSMYVNTDQNAACIETCRKYQPFFSGDHELPLAMALSYEKENDPANACKYAKAALEISGSVKTAKEIIRRCSG